MRKGLAFHKPPPRHNGVGVIAAGGIVALRIFGERGVVSAY